MNNKLTRYAASMLLAMGMMSASSASYAEETSTAHFSPKTGERSTIHAESISVFADIGAYSNYVWRGTTLSNSEFSVQGDVGIEHESGLSANVWFATLGSINGDTEYDITLDYSGEAGDIGYSVGYIRYDLIKNPAAVSEVYVGASFGPVSATYYRDITSKTNHFEVGAGHSIEGVVDLSASAGFNTYENVTLGASKDFEMDAVTLTPSLTIAIPTGGQKAGNKTEYAVGLNASF